MSDAHATEPVLERMEQDIGLPKKLVAYVGCGNKDTLDSCKERGVTPVCAVFNIKKIAALLPGQRRVTSEQGAIRSASKRSRPGFLLFRSLAVRFIRPTTQWASAGLTTGPRRYSLT